MMGRSNDLGTIERGKLADLTVLKGDPCSNLSALGMVEFVVKDGHVFDAASRLNEDTEQIVQRQVNAYNCHDAKVFAGTYAANGEVARPSAHGRTRAAIETAYRGLFANNPQLRVEILDRDVSGETVVDEEHIAGFADGSARDATVTYTVREGAIVRAQAQGDGSAPKRSGGFLWDCTADT